MGSEENLLDIGMAMLEDDPCTDSQSLRLKAGILALLNLLSIVETFYKAPEDVASSEDGKSGPQRTEAPSGDNPLSAALRALGRTKGGSIDTGVISALLGMLSSMKTRLKSENDADKPKEGDSSDKQHPPLDPKLLTLLLNLMAGLDLTKLRSAEQKTQQPEVTCQAGESDSTLPITLVDDGQSLVISSPGRATGKRRSYHTPGTGIRRK